MIYMQKFYVNLCVAYRCVYLSVQAMIKLLFFLFDEFNQNWPSL